MRANDFVIGVDVGGTKVSVATLRGASTAEPLLLPTDRTSAEALVAQIVAHVGKVSNGEPPLAAEICAPAVFAFASARARSSVNVPIQDVPLRPVLSERLGLPV